MIDSKTNFSTADEYTNGIKILLHTNMGDITIQLRNDMPLTTDNFQNLVVNGTFNGTIFHRVIDGFMIQGGDPTGTGYGDSSIPEIKDEFTSKNHNIRGTIAMANAGPNTGSSQFFINIENNAYLDAKHPQFGKVIAGMDVVDKIAQVKTNQNDKPLKEIIIANAEIVS
ncbi:MAG: peptidylprolyl isomerase [Nitrososphaerota archaeon]|jgi:peptidylprolyl isomerase|nr:peptidylprolyl isomerase [Nitrososphaerota archaeon]